MKTFKDICEKLQHLEELHELKVSIVDDLEELSKKVKLTDGQKIYFTEKLKKLTGREEGVIKNANYN